mmetsp:Transcript_3776/g.7684  ORF Transcript_3776/g.7684 Transcript_3776/m.7684 type:complete len:586 (+) Transcript_3776:276-2033(+)
MTVDAGLPSNGPSDCVSPWHLPFTLTGLDCRPVQTSACSHTGIHRPLPTAMPNCHFSLNNVDEHNVRFDDAEVPFDSPGRGAYTPWIDRTSTAALDIDAGSELFVSYGEAWFSGRVDELGIIPVGRHYAKAERFMGRYADFAGRVREKSERGTTPGRVESAQSDLWDVIRNFPYETGQRNALPRHYDGAVRVAEDGKSIKAVEREQSIRPMEYLERRGKCADNLRGGTSSIPHAGHGAFATRRIERGGLVAPAPVVHFPHSEYFEMYDVLPGLRVNNTAVRDEGKPLGKQLLLNYCFGHPNSTMLLFPYGSGVGYINHHSEDYNAEVRWARDFDFFHNKDWLNRSLDELKFEWRASLMLEYIALRDIEEGEEVLIDYGKEWSDAWEAHRKDWVPPSAEDLAGEVDFYSREDEDTVSTDEYDSAHPVLPTQDELLSDPRPASVEQMCYVNLNHLAAYLHEPETTPKFEREYGDVAVLDGDDDDEGHSHPCAVVDREYVGGGRTSRRGYSYTVRIETVKRSRHLTRGDFAVEETHFITDVPRDAFFFAWRGYGDGVDGTTRRAFRHPMMLPDAIFPEAWRNGNESLT